MQAALELLRGNIRRSRDLVSVSRAINIQTSDALDFTDILRSAMVMSVSALDHFVHEIVRLGMLEAYRGERAAIERTAEAIFAMVALEQPPTAAGSEPSQD